jgi:Diphthamide synthase
LDCSGLCAKTGRRGSAPWSPIALSWSGGKDSALALWTLRRQALQPQALITTVTEGYDRISMHGVRRDLLARQADALGIPLVQVVIPPACVNEVYEARMAEAFASAPLSGVGAVAFGDLFLEDVRAYREARLAAAAKRGLFPLWGSNTGELAREFIAAGFEAIIVCLDPRALDPASPDARTTSSSWPSCPRASIHAARTASSTPSSTPARSSRSRSHARPARSSSATASSSATSSRREARRCHRRHPLQRCRARGVLADIERRGADEIVCLEAPTGSAQATRRHVRRYPRRGDPAAPEVGGA